MRDEIIKMARESGMELYGFGKDREKFVFHLERFFHMAQAAVIERNKEIYKQLDETEKSLDEAVRVAVEMEREACAKEVDFILRPGGGTMGDTIRARGQA